MSTYKDVTQKEEVKCSHCQSTNAFFHRRSINIRNPDHRWITYGCEDCKKTFTKDIPNLQTEDYEPIGIAVPLNNQDGRQVTVNETHVEQVFTTYESALAFLHETEELVINLQRELEKYHPDKT